MTPPVFAQPFKTNQDNSNSTPVASTSNNAGIPLQNEKTRLVIGQTATN